MESQFYRTGVFIKEEEITEIFLSPPCENTARQCVRTRERTLTRNLTPLEIYSWTFQVPGCEKINFSGLSHLIYDFIMAA